MKKLLLSVMVLAFVFTANAQKVKLVDGKLDFLKGQKELKLKFTYDKDMKIGKMKMDDYINKKVKERNDKEPGSGDLWKEKFQSDLDTAFPRYFENMFNMWKKKIATVDVNAAAADYIMVVNTTFVEPGYNVGISSKRPTANMEVSFVKADDPYKVLAKFTITKVPGNSMFGSGYTFKDRVGGCYENAANALAGYFVRKKTFKE